MSTQFFTVPNDAYPFKSTKSTVRHTNFDADGNALIANPSTRFANRTFTDVEGHGEIEVEASTIIHALDGSNLFVVPHINNVGGVVIGTTSFVTLRAEAGGGDCAASFAAGVALTPKNGIVYAPDHGSYPNGVMFEAGGSIGNLTAEFTGKFYVDVADGIPDSASIKKETKKATRATYTVLD